MSDTTPTVPQQPQVITLDNNNSVLILLQFVEMAQKSGAFLLQEADILKRAKDVLVNNTNDPEVTKLQARQLLCQAVVKGQRHGSYTLEDASNLFKVVTFVSNMKEEEHEPVTEDLEELSEPVVLKSKPRTI